MLLQPLLDALFQQLVAMPPTDELVGWATEVDHGAAFDSIRAVELARPAGAYRLMKVDVTLIADKRSGHLIIALPLQDQLALPADDTETGGDWATMMQGAVSLAPATLDGVLHKSALPLGVVTGLPLDLSSRLMGQHGRLCPAIRAGWAFGGDNTIGASRGHARRAFGARATARDARYSGTQCGGDRECGLGQRVDLSAHAAQFIAGLLGCAQNIIRGHLSCLDQRP